jgi:DNA-binding CsgD family transcriptional regulator
MAAIRKTGTKEEEDVFASFGQVAAAVSLPDFHERLLAAVGRLVTHDIHSMMRYSRFSAPDFLGNGLFSPDFIARYEAEAYRYDPYYRYWKQTERPGVMPLRRVSASRADRNRYANFVLTEANITDEICIFLPPVGGSSVALFYDRCGGRFAETDIARLERVYPLITGLHQAHVSCLMSGSWELEGEVGAAALPQARPIRILDREKRELFHNAAWQRLMRTKRKGLAAALAHLDRSKTGAATLEPGLVLHRAPLPAGFGLAPGGVIDTLENIGQAPAAPGQPTLPPPLAGALTKREQGIVDLILQGHPTRTIAEKLSLTPGTVKNYRRRIYEKLDITTEREIFLAVLAAGRQRG